MSAVTVYEKHRCSTCRKLRDLLDEHGVTYELVEYHATGLTQDELRGLLRRAGLGPRDVLRTREPLVTERGLPGDLDDDALIALMVEHPALVQRPIVVSADGQRAVLARPIERALDIAG
ncbi:MAG: arsenate reductase [Solirubrobacterales bacterium]|nr:arsenate reductase [Solirubrobacterales bacterium]